MAFFHRTDSVSEKQHTLFHRLFNNQFPMPASLLFLVLFNVFFFLFWITTFYYLLAITTTAKRFHSPPVNSFLHWTFSRARTNKIMPMAKTGKQPKNAFRTLFFSTYIQWCQNQLLYHDKFSSFIFFAFNICIYNQTITCFLVHYGLPCYRKKQKYSSVHSTDVCMFNKAFFFVYVSLSPTYLTRKRSSHWAA